METRTQNTAAAQHYIDLFLPEAQSRFSADFSACNQLRAEIVAIETNLDAEEHRGETLRKEIESLKADTATQLAGRVEDYQAFKEKISSLQNNFDTTSELLKAARDVVLPKKKTAAKEADLNLKNALMEFLRQKRYVADREINALIFNIIALYDGFQEAQKQIFRDFGQSLAFTWDTLCPGIFATSEIEEFKRRIEHERVRQELLNPPKVKDNQESAAKQPTESKTLLTGDCITNPVGKDCITDGDVI